MKKHLLITSLFLFAVCTLSAQIIIDADNPTQPYNNTITTADPFLLIAPDARSGAMGDLGVATSADNYCQHHNPSKYVFNEDIFGIGVAYSPWLKSLVGDIHLIYLSSFWKPAENDAIAFSLRYFSLGDIDFTDQYGNKLVSVNPNEFTLDFTYARKLSKIVSMAITPRFIYSNLTYGYVDNDTGIEYKPGLAAAVDISLFVNKEFMHNMTGFKSSALMFGLNVSNIGNKVNYSKNGDKKEFLPCNLKLGLSYNMAFDDYSKLAVSVEAGKLLVPTPAAKYEHRIDSVTVEYPYYGNGQSWDDKNSIVGIGLSFGHAAGGYKENPAGCFREKMREIVWSVGLEYSYRDILFVRAGTFLENRYKGNRKFATIGAGVKYNIFAIDVCYLVAFTQGHPLENTLRFTLTFMLQSFNKDQIKQQGKLK